MSKPRVGAKRNPGSGKHHHQGSPERAKPTLCLTPWADLTSGVSPIQGFCHEGTWSQGSASLHPGLPYGPLFLTRLWRAGAGTRLSWEPNDGW